MVSDCDDRRGFYACEFFPFRGCCAATSGWRLGTGRSNLEGNAIQTETQCKPYRTKFQAPAFSALTDIGTSPCAVMKIIGICMPHWARRFWKSNPLICGSLTSRTRQPGPAMLPLPRNSPPVAKDHQCRVRPDAREPCREFAVAAKCVHVFVGSQKGILKRDFCIFSVSND